MIQIQTQVGSTGNASTLTTGVKNDLIVSEFNPRYYESCYRGNIFSGGNQAAVATVALGTTTYTGLSLSNPIGSGVNLVLLKASYVNSVAVPTAGYLGLETGFNTSTQVTHTTPATVYNNMLNSGVASKGLLDVSSTLPTAPVHRLGLAQCGSVATSGYGVSTPNVIDLEGSIILTPGSYVAFYTFATNTAAWFFTFNWLEVNI